MKRNYEPVDHATALQAAKERLAFEDERLFHYRDEDNYEGWRQWKTIAEVLYRMSPTHFNALLSETGTVQGTPEQVEALRELAAAYDKCQSVGVTNIK